ncbi:hypothetical protein MOB65_19150 [Bacillus inaquosorum]|uniref:hypothetical protein n=1 Tax=Bacillus inaquosorum TaxID=483913 RepID=UPI00227F2E27|nr:hypothetical protein [Bacillus inaquosorum]MCY7910981.1 hypothetical protein [Bacillus inaquosorum]
MTETNAKIHALADETLGGIKREYVEVDRKAEVGEKIVIVDADAQCEEPYNNGDIFETERLLGYIRGIKTTCHRDIHDFEYRVLEPTDIVHIDGPDGTQRYELTDREAEVGEKILTTQTQFGRLPVGKDLTVTDVFDDGSVGEWGVGIVVKTNYRVLVPVEAPEANEPQPADLIDVVSNLAKRVADLERENKKLHAALDEDMKIRSENTRRYLALKDEIDTLHKDSRTLGEELAQLKEPVKNESIIESAPFVLVIHEGRGEFDVYQRGKKIENISRLEIEAYSRLSSSIDLEFNDVGERP